MTYTLIYYAATSVLVTVVFAYLYRLKGREYFLWWTWGWAFESLRAVAETVDAYVLPQTLLHSVAHTMGTTSLVVSGVLFLVGTCQLCGARVPWGYMIAALGAVAGWALLTPLLRLGWSWAVTPGYVVAGGLMVAIGRILLSSLPRRTISGGVLLGILFLIWGLHLAAYPFGRFFVPASPLWQRTSLVRFAISSLLTVGVGVFMIVYVLEETGAVLRKTEERFRRIFWEASECILLADPHAGQILNANRRAQDLTGYSQGELRKKALPEVLLDPNTASAERSMERWIPDGNYPKSAILEMRLRHHDGRMIPVSVTRSAIDRDEGNRVILIHIRDETESQRSRLDLQVQFERLRALHQISTELSKALDGNRIYQIVFDKIRLILPLDLFILDLYDAETNQLKTVFGAERVGHTYRPLPTGATRAPSRTLFETLIRDRQPVLENRGVPLETDDSPLALDLTPSATGSGSRMFVPMVATDEVLGVISIQSNAAGAYDSSMLDLFQNLANITATSLGTSNLFFREHEHSERMRFLKDLGNAVASSFELVPTLTTAQNLITQFLHADSATIHLYDGTRGTLVSTAELGRRELGESGGSEEKDGDVPESSISCFATGQPVVEGERAPTVARGRLAAAGEPTPSSVSVPITMRGRPVGVLRVDDKRTPGRFGRTDVDLLLLIAKQLAVAVENTRAYEYLRKSHEHFYSIVEHSPCGVAVIRNGEVTYANRVLRKLTTDTKAPPTHRPLSTLVDSASLVGFEEHIQRTLREQSSNQCEVGLLRPDGTSDPWQVELSPLPGNDPASVLAMFKEPGTFRRPREVQGEHQTQAIETLLAAIAGDFSSLFSGILGQTAYLKLLLKPGEGPARSIESIEETALCASEYLKQILTLREYADPSPPESNGRAYLESLLQNYAEIRKGRFRYRLEAESEVPSIQAPPNLFHLGLTGLLNALTEVLADEEPILVRVHPGSGTQPKEGGELDGRVPNRVEILFAPEENEVSREKLESAIQPGDSVGKDATPFGLPLSLGLFRLMGATLEIVRTDKGRLAIALQVPVLSVDDKPLADSPESAEPATTVPPELPVVQDSDSEVTARPKEEES